METTFIVERKIGAFMRSCYFFFLFFLHNVQKCLCSSVCKCFCCNSGLNLLSFFALLWWNEKSFLGNGPTQKMLPDFLFFNNKKKNGTNTECLWYKFNIPSKWNVASILHQWFSIKSKISVSSLTFFL